MNALTQPAQIKPANERTRAVSMMEQEPVCFRIAHLIGWVAGVGWRMGRDLARPRAIAKLNSTRWRQADPRQGVAGWIVTTARVLFRFWIEAGSGDLMRQGFSGWAGAGACIPARFMVQ
jgi:hypothetical protein